LRSIKELKDDDMANELEEGKFWNGNLGLREMGPLLLLFSEFVLERSPSYS